MVDLAVKVGAVTLQNPIMPASGTFSNEFAQVIDLNRLGALVTKTVSRPFRPGNPPPRVHEIESGMINSIALRRFRKIWQWIQCQRLGSVGVFPGNSQRLRAAVVCCCSSMENAPRASICKLSSRRESMSVSRPRYTVFPQPAPPMTASDRGRIFWELAW